MPYDPGLGLTVPPAVEEAGLAGAVVEAAADAEATFAFLGGPAAPVAAYALLNAHRRRVLLTLNLRELYHVSRLREDAHAQWDIRQLAGEMSCLARGAFPVCGALLGGKDKVALG
jgi:thymidylate synthase ThyX